ncbi:MAG TPA: hypothetical protein VM529_12875, partial [Gemmata sp.]|nr:hypothetical protein [Gemmata sp.]
RAMNPFHWLRRKAAEAVVAGTADGLRAVAPDDDPPADLAELRAMLAAAVAPRQLAAPDDEPARKGRK